MGILKQRGELNPASPSHRDEIEAGGRWVAFGDPDPDDLVAEIRARNVRSLVTFQRDLGFLRQVPQLEFLVVSSNPRDVSPIQELPNLRRLMFSGTWHGTLDFRSLPNLDSFVVNECPKDGGGLDGLFAGHPRLERLSIARSRLADLRPIAALSLRALGLSGGLTSLAGIEAQAEHLERLDLDGMPDLPSLDGIGVLKKLEVLAIEGLRHVTTIDWVQGLPSLRLLDISDLKGVETLRPLAGHPNLEYVTFGRVKDLDLEPLDHLPKLRLMLTGNYRWNRPLSDLPQVGAVPIDHPDRRDYYGLVLG